MIASVFRNEKPVAQGFQPVFTIFKSASVGQASAWN